jgi:histidyl-tRNA synthetase
MPAHQRVDPDHQHRPHHVGRQQLADAHLNECLAIATDLRGAGIATEVALEGGKLGKQLKYADRAGIRLAVVAGQDELSRGVLAVKDLRQGDQIEVPRAGLAKALLAILAQDEAAPA